MQINFIIRVIKDHFKLNKNQKLLTILKNTHGTDLKNFGPAIQSGQQE